LRNEERAVDGRPSKPVRLSKSKLTAYEICPRRFWLQIHRPALARHEPDTLRIFAAGHMVGELARARYPQGILVAEGHTEVDAALARTADLIQAPVPHPIFEGAFIRDDVVIRADILEPDGCGAWKLAEVKNTGRIKPYQLADAAIQSWVLAGNNISLSSVIIRHVQRPVRSANSIVRTRFVDADVTLDVGFLLAGRQRLVNEARLVAQQAEPAIEPGPQCLRPFRCEYRHYCQAAASPNATA
jgi:hypothetical protein